MSWVLANKTKQKDNTSWNPCQTMEEHWHRYVHFTQ